MRPVFLRITITDASVWISGHFHWVFPTLWRKRPVSTIPVKVLHTILEKAIKCCYETESTPWVFSLVISLDIWIFCSTSNRYVQSGGTLLHYDFWNILLRLTDVVSQISKQDYELSVGAQWWWGSSWGGGGEHIIMAGVCCFFLSHAAALTAESVLLRMTSGRLQTDTHHRQPSVTPAFFFFIDIDSPVVSHLKRMRGALSSTQVRERRDVAPKQE